MLKEAWHTWVTSPTTSWFKTLALHAVRKVQLLRSKKGAFHRGTEQHVDLDGPQFLLHHHEGIDLFIPRHPREELVRMVLVQGAKLIFLNGGQ